MFHQWNVKSAFIYSNFMAFFCGTKIIGILKNLIQCSYKFLYSVEHKRRYFEKLVTRKKYSMEVNGYPQLSCLVTKILQNNIFFCVQQKLVQVWNNIRVNKWWQNFHFLVNHPFMKFLEQIIVIELNFGHSNKFL